MNLYLVSQQVNAAYDTFDCAIICAPNEETARVTHPDGMREWKNGKWFLCGREEPRYLSSWTEPEHVRVEKIGVAADALAPGVVIASFNAG